jgi:hypothetical protein
MPPTTDWAIYNIRCDDYDGFQLGDPIRRPWKMSLEFYANDIEFEINIDQNVAGPAPAITQAEINRIIQTARKAPQAASVLTMNPS